MSFTIAFRDMNPSMQTGDEGELGQDAARRQGRRDLPDFRKALEIGSGLRPASESLQRLGAAQ
jgi:hypothetical protein